MHAELHAGFRVYNEGTLVSLLCGSYADIFYYFRKLYSIS